MNSYEELLQEAANKGVSVDENIAFQNNLKGLYVDGNIALSKELKRTCDKYCILAEELGHHETSSGNILNYKDTCSAKQELRARAWSYEKIISLNVLIKAFEYHCSNICEISEYLNVTESYLYDAINYYRLKYGVYVKYKEYTIYFEPSLAIYKGFKVDNPATADY